MNLQQIETLIAKDYLVQIYGRSLISWPNTLWLEKIRECRSRFRNLSSADREGLIKRYQ